MQGAGSRERHWRVLCYQAAAWGAPLVLVGRSWAHHMPRTHVPTCPFQPRFSVINATRSHRLTLTAVKKTDSPCSAEIPSMVPSRAVRTDMVPVGKTLPHLRRNGCDSGIDFWRTRWMRREGGEPARYCSQTSRHMRSRTPGTPCPPSEVGRGAAAPRRTIRD